MRWKVSAGVLVPLAFLIPAAPAVAQTESPVLNEVCQTVERKVFKDFRELVAIDLDTATDVQVRVLADQLLSEAKAEGLPTVSTALQKGLDGSADELRAFLKANLQRAWTVDLRISVGRTLTGAGANVNAAAQKVLDGNGVDVYLAYLNDGLYAARVLDCAAQPSPSSPTPSPSVSSRPTSAPSVTPSASSAAAIPGSSASSGTSGGDGGGLPVTGDATGTVAGIGGALVLLGGAGYLVGRRRRSRFVA
ncbi:LPXTG cell wall anchor domain-containing protein [Actinoplanes palleronii]|uniref:LPXTG-motif cell wall-anchored protein n=1 Tax=Actinoplanes palleronii TaxID=113570 RepID=A0ABQ4BT07_9ACTN|nr:LPXTG cell wall anchor domain-containing protein [Actinoplanes palleronii]GIE73828.1 hypothetical protein Apa02nite_099360 [Actinoplanes palleronii]